MIVLLLGSFLYFIIVFSAGFVLGVVRNLLLLRILSDTAAVLVELPFMLVISWLAARAVMEVNAFRLDVGEVASAACRIYRIWTPPRLRAPPGPRAGVVVCMN